MIVGVGVGVENVNSSMVEYVETPNGQLWTSLKYQVP